MDSRNLQSEILKLKMLDAQLWRGSRRPESRSRRLRTRPAGCPRGSGSSAPSAPRSSTTRISRPTSTSARSARTTSASTPAERLRMLFDGDWIEHDNDLVSTDPLDFTDTKPYKARLEGEHRGDRPQGRGHRRVGRDRRHRDVVARWSTASSAAPWASSSARRSRAPSSARSTQRSAGRHRLLLGRRAHAGRRAVADADGEDLRRAGAARSGAAAVHLRAHRSDDRRRDGELRDARRPQHRRAEGADRLRRPARHRADDPPEAARGIPAHPSSCSRRACSTWSSIGAR